MDENELTVVSCPSCSQRFRVRSQSAGRAVKCPHCAQAVTVPISATAPKTQPAPQSQERFQLGPPTTQPNMSAAPASGAPTPVPHAATATSPTSAEPVFNPAAFQPSQQAPQSHAAELEPGQQTDLNPFQSPTLEFAATPLGGLPAKRRYPALQIIRMVYLVMACLAVVGWAIYMAVTLVMAARIGAVGLWFFASLVPTASTAAAVTVMVAAAELIKLALDVQSNTLTTARNTSRH